MTVVPKRAESFGYGVGEIVLCPWVLGAVLPAREAVLLKFIGFQVERPREISGYFMGNGPDRYSVCAEFLTEEILVKFDESIDAILGRILYCFSHELKIGLVELTFLGFDSGPHDSQSDTVDAQFLEMFHIAFVEFCMIGGCFADEIQSVEDEFASSVVHQSPVSDMNSGKCQMHEEQSH